MSRTPASPTIWLTVHSRSRVMRPIAISSVTRSTVSFRCGSRWGRTIEKICLSGSRTRPASATATMILGRLPIIRFQGGVAMGFYNMNTGDAPFFKQMADFYAIGDNYHQAIMGGTGSNFLALVTGDTVPFYNDQGQFGIPATSFTYQG